MVMQDTKYIRYDNTSYIVAIIFYMTLEHKLNH